MNEINLNLSTSQNIQSYLLLSKFVKGIANSKLITDALNAPGVYVYSELYESPNVTEASKLPEVKPYYDLLSLFLNGTYTDYVENMPQLPALTDTQLVKLKQLSIITLSEKNRTLSYQDMQKYLDISTVRDLEDLIIDAIYQGILTGKLDQRNQQLQINTAIGRDLRSNQLNDIINNLSSWTQQASTLIEVLENKIQHINQHIIQNEANREQYELSVEQIRKEVHANEKAAVAASPSSLDKSSMKKDKEISYDSQEYADRLGGRAKKRQIIG
ncbi:unnamed protein product [Cunninghamella blakesleeana]